MAVAKKNKNVKPQKEEKKEEIVAEQKIESKPKKRGFLFRVFRIIIFVSLFLGLIAGGFALGVYFNFFSPQELAQKLELYKYPVIGQYFKQGEENQPIAEENTNDVKVNFPPEPTVNKVETNNVQDMSKPVVVDKEEMKSVLSGTFSMKTTIAGEPVTIGNGRFDVTVGEINFFKKR